MPSSREGDCSEAIKNFFKSHQKQQFIKNPTKIELIVVDEKNNPYNFINKKTPETFVEVIHSINSTIGKNILIPKEMKLFIQDVMTDPIALAHDRVLHVPERFQKEISKKMYKENPSESIAILAHEYGHILFAENARMYFSFIKDEQKLLTEIAANKVSMVEKLAFLKQLQMEKQLTDEQVANEPLFKEVLAILEKNNALQVKLGENKAVIELYIRRKTAFDELWSDLVSVMYTHKSDGIVNALKITGSPKGGADRAMLKRMARENGRRDLNAHISHNNNNPGTAHSLLAESLKHVWHNYLKRPSVMARKAEVAEALLRALFKDVQNTMNLSDQEILAPNFVSEINRHLINTIDEELVDFN